MKFTTDIRLKKRSFICQSTLFLLIASPLLYIWMEMQGKIIGGAT